MVCMIVGHVGQEEEVTVAVVEFKLRGSDVVVVEAEIGEEEALDVALALDGVTHCGELLVAVGHILKTIAPLSIERHTVEMVSKFRDIDRAVLRQFV